MKRRSRGRTVRLSFALTFGSMLLIFVIAITLLPGGVAIVTKHIPATIPTYDGVIGKYAPYDALQVSFNNFTAIRGINQSALLGQTYLTFSNPRTNITVASIESRITVVLSKPNATVDVVILSPGAFASAFSVFNQSGLQSTHVGSNVLYFASELSFGKTITGWVSMLSGSRAFVSSTGDTAQGAVSMVLDVYDGSQSSLISKTEVQRSFYVLNGTDNHLGIAIQNYAGTVTSGKITLITIDEVSNSLAINYAVKFSNSTFASSQIGYFERAYIIAGKFVSYDDVLLARETQPLSALTKVIVLVG